MRLSIPILLSALALPAPALANEPMAPLVPGASATKARDISGFELGEPVREAVKRTSVEFVQGELVETTLNDIEYDFGVCPSGRIYRIQSSQTLGSFIPDQQFISQLQAQLFEKYGPTNPSSSGIWGWDLVEPVRYFEGDVHAFKTNWFSVMLSGGYGAPVTIDMTMIDFRICWEDRAKLNRAPREAATKGVRF
jgi:hypothetical protein